MACRTAPAITVSTHSRLKAAESHCFELNYCRHVSTHSRLKAADSDYDATGKTASSFNTQPPEGG